MPIRNSVVLLVSGGIDSSALIDFYLRQKENFLCVHFQYGQASERSERQAVVKVCSHYNVDYEISNLFFPMTERKDELIFRNLLFILAACSLKDPPLRIALGIHAGTQYYDCTRSFLQDCQKILDGYYSGLVNVEAPFIDYSKRDIIKFCETNDVPLNLTYSCLMQNEPPCGQCKPCRDRIKFLE